MPLEIEEATKKPQKSIPQINKIRTTRASLSFQKKNLPRNLQNL